MEVELHRDAWTNAVETNVYSRVPRKLSVVSSVGIFYNFVDLMHRSSICPLYFTVLLLVRID